MSESRIKRVARGSGRTMKDVTDMLEEYKRIAKVCSKLKKKLPKNMDRNVMNNKDTLNTINNLIPKQLLNQIGDVNPLQSVMKQMGLKT